MSAKRSRIKKETTFGSEVIHGVKDFFRSVKRGETITIRTIKLNLQPREYHAEQVRLLRTRLRVSQAIFAQLLAVSVDLIQAWEQGTSVPTPMARRLLDDISSDPQGWLQRHAKISQMRKKSA